jgi:hypothetical protein
MPFVNRKLKEIIIQTTPLAIIAAEPKLLMQKTLFLDIDLSL